LYWGRGLQPPFVGVRESTFQRGIGEEKLEKVAGKILKTRRQEL